MAELTEGRHSGEFLLSTGNGNISFDNATLAEGNLAAGTVLGIVDGDYVALDPGSSGDDAEAVAILLSKTDATDDPKPCAVVARQAEVIGAALVWPEGISDPDKATAIAELAAKGIIVR